MTRVSPNCDSRRMERIGRQVVGEAPDDAHRAFARVAHVGHRAGVEVRRRSEVAVGLLGLADE